MKMLTIKQLLDLPDGTPVEATCGIIEQVYPPKEKPNCDPGDTKYWKFQHLILSAGADKIKISLVKRETLGEKWVGETVYVKSQKNKMGFTGVKVKNEKYTKEDGDEVENKILWVTGTGVIEAEEAFPMEVKKQDDDLPFGDESKSMQKQSEKTEKDSNFVEAKKIVSQVGNLWGVALQAAVWHINHIEDEEVRYNFLHDAAAVQAAVATIVIQAAKIGGLRMPSGDIYIPKTKSNKSQSSDNDGENV